MTEATPNDVLVAAAAQIVAMRCTYVGCAYEQVGDDDDMGTYGSTSAIEQLRAALTLARDGATQ